MRLHHAPRHWLRLGVRLASLSFFKQERSTEFITRGYDAASISYDSIWIDHMREFTDEMINKLSIERGMRCLDLACGTGYVTGRLALLSAGEVTGVDASEGMLAVARHHHPKCRFVHDDVLRYLRNSPSESVDVITCAWGLGYSHPSKILHEIARVLKPGGRLGIIDNSILSLKEIYLIAFQVLAEQPDVLAEMLHIRFLLGYRTLSLLAKWHGLQVLDAWGGRKGICMKNGRAAIARMKATGAAAGFESLFDPRFYDEREARFVQLLEDRYGDAIPVIHRYIAVIGRKP